MMSKINDLTKDFVKNWMTNPSFEKYINKGFQKSKEDIKGYWYISENQKHSINLQCYFESLLDDFVEYLLDQKTIGELNNGPEFTALNEEIQKSIENLDNHEDINNNFNSTN